MPYARLIVWDDDACWRVHEATLALLEETGVEVRHQDARELLADAGARVEGTRARIPAALVDAALQTAPRRFALKARTGGGDGHARRGELGGLELRDGNSYFGTGSDCVYVVDPDSGERRQATTADVEGMAALCEHLVDIDFVMTMGLPGDVPAASGDLAQFAAMLAGTRKPLLATAHDAASLRKMRDMAALCGEARSFGCYAMPNPPLMHSEEAIDKVVACAELDIPLIYAPAPALGTTAPASIAATVVVGNAETLSGLVVHQLTRRGAPFVYGVGCGAFDMRTAADVYGAPEHFLGNAAATDLARFYGLPSFAYAGVADAKILDEQWAAEAGITAVLGALSRATLLHDVGYLRAACRAATRPSCSATSWSATRGRCSPRWAWTRKSLALNEIDAVGPGGSHLGRDFTRRHHRGFWSPSLFDRAAYERWHAAGASTLKERVKARTEELRGEPRGFRLEDSVRERVAALAETGGSRR